MYFHKYFFLKISLYKLKLKILPETGMVRGMVQNSQSLYLFTFNAFIIIHEYIYSHSTTIFIFKKYINSHLTTYVLFTNIFTHIYEMYSFTFNGVYSFTFTIEILVQHGAIFIQHFLRTVFAHHRSQLPLHNF